jgi:hypothetical protein
MTEKATLQMVLKSKIGGKRLLQIFEEAFGNVLQSLQEKAATEC